MERNQWMERDAVAHLPVCCGTRGMGTGAHPTRRSPATQCSRKRQCRAGWRSILAMGALLAYLVSATCTMAAQATPVPTQAEAAAAAATTPQVTVEHATFGPTTLTISIGTTVTWANHDGDLHTVTSSQGLFTSPGLDPGDTFSYRFTAPGTYLYFCALHPHMKGTIVVQ